MYVSRRRGGVRSLGSRRGRSCGTPPYTSLHLHISRCGPVVRREILANLGQSRLILRRGPVVRREGDEREQVGKQAALHLRSGRSSVRLWLAPRDTAVSRDAAGIALC